MPLVSGTDDTWDRQNGDRAQRKALPSNSIFKPLNLFRRFSRTEPVEESVSCEFESRDAKSSGNMNTNHAARHKPLKVNFANEKVSSYHISNSAQNRRHNRPTEQKALDREIEKKRYARERYQRRNKEEQKTIHSKLKTKNEKKLMVEQEGDDEEEEDPESLMKIITDDNSIPSEVSQASDLPNNSYKSLCMILKPSSPKYNQPDTRYRLNNPVPVVASKRNQVNNKILHPISILPASTATRPSNFEIEEVVVVPPSSRHPPEPFVDLMDDRPPWEMDTLTAKYNEAPPVTLEGVIWPKEYASDPPYVTPGYEGPGIRQPTGVVSRTNVMVPARPRTAVINGVEKKIPAWVSPLYRPYGIGGPYGPNGPFFQPCRDQELRTQIHASRQTIRCPLKRQYIKWRYGQDASELEAIVEAVKASLENAKKRVDSRRKQEDFLKEVVRILSETSAEVKRHMPRMQQETSMLDADSVFRQSRDKNVDPPYSGEIEPVTGVPSSQTTTTEGSSATTASALRNK